MAPDEKNILLTLLTARPLRRSGVTTNEVFADVDYVFPAGKDNWLGLTDTPTTRFTVIFSPVPLTHPDFLNSLAGHRMMPAEQQVWERFRSQFIIKAPEAMAGTPLATVRAPAEPAAGQPIIFDITIKLMNH